MGVQEVFRSLQDIFPQVDLRILKAAALEHANDVNAAVEFILYEVLPSMGASYASDNRETEPTSAESGGNKEVGTSKKQDVGDVSTNMLSGSESVVCGCASSGDYASPLLMSPRVEVGDGVGVECSSDPGISCSLIPNRSVSVNIPFRNVSDNAQAGGSLSDVLNGKVDSLESFQSFPVSAENGTNTMDHTSQELHGLVSKEASSSKSQYQNLSVHYQMGCEGVLDNDASSSTSEIEEQLPQCSNMPIVTQIVTSAKDIQLPEQEELLNFKNAESAVQNYVSNSTTNCNDQQLGASHEESHSLPSDVTTQSGYVVSVDLLEDFIADAKSSKTSLVSAVEMVKNMMKDVELLEERAKQVKEEASTAGHDILTRVEEMKQMLKHATEANKMHAAEVTGEKTVLTTEAQELQSRLLCLSDERNKYLSAIEEMHKTLDARMLAAEEDLAVAENSKLEKIEAASKSLHEQELVMDALVKESKLLQQQAEENSKLREFLIDRGHVVDVLQAEIAVICDDVLLLKERVDGGDFSGLSPKLPTPSLASSSNSFSDQILSLSDRVAGPELPSGSMSLIDRVPSPAWPAESPKSTDSEESKMQQPEETFAGYKLKLSTEDGWDLFEPGWEFA